MSKTTAQLNRDIASVLKRSGNPEPKWEGSAVQSLLFSRVSWTEAAAKAWAHEHNYRSGKVHVTDDYIRLRQFPPVSGRQKRTIRFGAGIKAIIEQTE